MTYRTGTVHQNNVFVRCPFCGDSTHRSYVGHLSINLHTGNYICFRCSAKGRLSTQEHFKLLEDYEGASSLAQIDDVELPNLDPSIIKEETRVTLLEHAYDHPFRVYAMRSPTGYTIGYHYRHFKEKWSYHIGKLGFGYVGNYLVHPELRIVEGVYDVVYPTDVTVFGSITAIKLKALYPFSLTLAPDGDIIHNAYKRKSFLSTLSRLLKDGFDIQGIEVFNASDDPHSAYMAGKRGTMLSVARFFIYADELTT
jgi:hypothetical protein